MNDLVLANRAADWRGLKALVLDSVSSPITRRVYDLALDEFIEWFGFEPRPGLTKARERLAGCSGSPRAWLRFHQRAGMSEKVVWQLLQQYAAMVAFRVWLRTTSALSESTSACIRPEPTEWLFGRCRSLDAYGIVRSLPQSRNPNLQLGDEFKRSVPICFRRRSNDKQRASGKAIRWFVAKSTFSQPRDDRLRGVTEDKDYAASLVSERHPSAVNAFSCGIAAVPVQSCVAPQGANWSRSNCCSVISPSKRPSGICTRQDLGHAPNDGIKPRVAI